MDEVKRMSEAIVITCAGCKFKDEEYMEFCHYPGIRYSVLEEATYLLPPSCINFRPEESKRWDEK